MDLKDLDPTGAKKIAETVEKITDAGIDGAKIFLSLTSKPLLEELGMMARDKFSSWRLNNIIRTINKAQGKLKYDPEKEKLTIDPRVAFQIAENASTVSNDTLQDMWAGLFASSVGKYEEDENIFFIDALKRLTSAQVKVLSYVCENSHKTLLPDGQYPDEKSIGIKQSDLYEQEIEGLYLKFEHVSSIMGTNDDLKIDTEIDALENMDLIVKAHTYPFNIVYISSMLRKGLGANVKPTLKALRLFIKCQGSNETPYEYFVKNKR
jgi:hypothetical protein